MGWFRPEMPVRVSWPQAVRYAWSRPGFRLGLALFWCRTMSLPYAAVTGYVARAPRRSPEDTEPEAQLVPPGVGGRTTGAEAVRRLLSGRRPLSLLLRLPGHSGAAATWVCFHPGRIWVGGRTGPSAARSATAGRTATAGSRPRSRRPGTRSN